MTKLPRIVLLVLGVINVLRGTFHWLAPDSGAGMVARMNLQNAGGANIIFLLAADGISQIVWGMLYLHIALREQRFIRLIFLLEIFKSGALLLTEYTFKRPIPPVPGRFMHMATLLVSLGMVTLIWLGPPTTVSD